MLSLAEPCVLQRRCLGYYLEDQAQGGIKSLLIWIYIKIKKKK